MRRCTCAQVHKGQGRVRRRYQAYPPEIIATLPVREVVARDAWLLMWWPDPHLPALIETMNAFGFTFSGKGFTWVKVLKSVGRNPGLISTAAIEMALHTGGGKTTRKNSRSCWLGRIALVDDRLRGTMRIFGTGTGRWVGLGPQLQEI